MASILLGIAVNILTRLSKKIKVSKTYVSVFLSLLLGTSYYFAKMFFGEESLEMLLQKTAEIYAVSQVIYNFILKIQETWTKKK